MRGVPLLEVVLGEGDVAGVLEDGLHHLGVARDPCWGIQIRGPHDFGVALQDPRGGVKSTGEA